MPELPEVETIRRGLVALVRGARITSVTPQRPDLRFPFPEGMAALAGARIEGISRRAKYLIFEFDDGHVLLSHLGMTGAWRVDSTILDEPSRLRPGQRGGAHDHLLIGLDREGQAATLIYNDPRRFGYVVLASGADAAAPLVGLGPEPLGNGFSPEHLFAEATRRAAPIKAVLLDQHVVAGLGNIYVCEALWRAGISPTRPARDLTATDCVRLVAAIRAVLEAAIAAGGSTLRDYVNAEGNAGYFQHSFDVYAREGEPCRTPGCDGTVMRIVQSGRSSFYCPDCQSK